MPHQLPAHGLVVFPLLEGVAGAVAVLVEGQAGIGEPLAHEVRDDGLLVFDGRVVPVQLLVHRDAAVACNVVAFDHGVFSCVFGCLSVLSNYSSFLSLAFR